ncbi:MAG TPA: DUF4097 family beta strand repeat-containing protein [Verrucomicrobiae bacterium]|nr:DUF4097 family beta strand repeat-containing protein [Verrucomicrobiae bacterium]
MKHVFKQVIRAAILLAAFFPLRAQAAVTVYADDTTSNSAIATPQPPAATALNPTPPPATPSDVRYETAGEPDFSKSFTVAPGGSLNVQANRGDIHVAGTDQNTVQIRVLREVSHASDAEAARALKDHHVVLEQHGNEISVTAEEPRRFGSASWWRWWGQPNLNVHYQITVPQAFDARLKTEGGDIAVATLHGNVTAKTEGGSLKFNGIHGNVNGKTEGGNVDAVACHDELQLLTEGGNISIEQFTGNGLQARTEGGSIFADFAVPPRADCALHTDGGNVTVKIPETAAVNLDAHTDGGTTRTDLPIQLKARLDGETLRGTINGGGPALKLTTQGGNVRVLKR